ncbi:XAC2610-related protein [Pedobacter jamesrossensis]|uniref:XAC2610-related protein n=1 Tax=Pedobacter jamesrossensis TaxID=1908238 RepID=A0ABV8NK98_9SPHI
MRLILYLFLMLYSTHLMAQKKVFNQPNTKGTWQYIYPFADKSYVLAIQHGVKDNEEDGAKTTNLYFGKIGKTDKIFWKEQLVMRLMKDNVNYEDFNGDGVKDLLIFEDTGARGGNAFYNLYLINHKNHTLTKVKDFNRIVNPSYDKKHKIIISYSLSGENYYSIYKLNVNNKPYQIGNAFKETDELDLDKKIGEILKENKK